MLAVSRPDSDVAVVGGGPAGCAAAIMLARCGHAVTLITKTATDALPLGESIPPSTRKLFDLLGVSRDVDAAGFARAAGNTVWWGRDTPRIEHFADGERGWQVTNAELERVLRAAAERWGVRLQTSRASVDDGMFRNVSFVLDCTGRGGLFARGRRLRANDSGLTTVAVVGLWAAPAFALPDPTHTVIESYEGGWAWSVPVAAPRAVRDARRFVAVMVDPRTSNLAPVSDSQQFYLAELRKATRLHHMLAGATLTDGPRGWDASMYHAVRYVDDNVLLVGDAGSFIDPLSSAGVKKALASGWLAAVAAHTCLVRPEMRRIALDFFDAREREVYQSFRTMTEAYWRDAAAWHAHPFWSDRAITPEQDLDRDVLTAAYERVRHAPTLCVRPNPAVTIAARPTVSGTEVVLEERLVRDGTTSGVRYVYDVDLLALVALAPDHDSVPALFDSYNERHAPVPLPDFLAALATALAERWLLWCDTY